MLQEAKEVCPTKTRRLIVEGALLVDVREPREVSTLAIDVPDILYIPLSELEVSWREIPKDREVVMLCQGGGRSLKATYYLQYHGYTNVSNMAGGIEKWTKKGFPTKGQNLAAVSHSTDCCGEADVNSGLDGGGCCAVNSDGAFETSCCGGQATGSS